MLAGALSFMGRVSGEILQASRRGGSGATRADPSRREKNPLQTRRIYQTSVSIITARNHANSQQIAQVTQQIRKVTNGCYFVPITLPRLLPLNTRTLNALRRKVTKLQKNGQYSPIDSKHDLTFSHRVSINKCNFVTFSLSGVAIA